MPLILKSLVRQLTAKHVANAWAIAVARLQKVGILQKGSSEKLTAKGKRREALGHAGRHKKK